MCVREANHRLSRRTIKGEGEAKKRFDFIIIIVIAVVREFVQPSKDAEHGRTRRVGTTLETATSKSQGQSIEVHTINKYCSY